MKFTLPPRVPNGYTLLDVCSKAGGAGLGYYLAGFNVVSVDREPQPHQPFPFIQADLRDLDPEWIAQNFDATAWSPPCWKWSDLAHRTGLDYEDFIPEARALAKACGLPYVIENVEGAPLDNPLILCGTQFPGLRVSRHRLFESNLALYPPRPHGRHPLHFTHDKRKKHYGRLDEMTAFVTVTGGGNSSKAAAEDAMGIPSGWMTKDELNQAIPPAYTQWIGGQLADHLAAVEGVAA